MPIQLKPHQTKIVKYMKESDARGIILFHGLGSGKTITSIAISKIYDSPVLVIVPASMRTQWIPELKKMEVIMSQYQVTSYEGFLSSVESGKIETLENYVVLVDEAHRIRSTSGKIATTMVRLLQTAKKIILLTGTPMVNSPLDMSPLINSILGNNVLPMTEKAFREKFYILQSKSPPRLNRRCLHYSCVTCSGKGVIYKNGLCPYHYVKSLRTAKQKKTIVTSDLEGLSMKDWKKKQTLRINKARAIAKLGIYKPNTSEYSKYVAGMVSYYQPTKTIDDFPSVTTHIKKVAMSEKQNKVYLKAQRGVNIEDLNLLKSGIEITRKSSAMNAFLNATRQISNTWNGQEDTPKLKKIISQIISGPKPALVYSNWIGNGLRPLGSMLAKKEVRFLEFTGGMTDRQKNKVVSDFNNGELDVLLLSSSGGEGLDLKNTRQIHIMEPHWNEAKISQVIGRGIRYKSHASLPPQERHVDVYHWISTPLGKKKTQKKAKNSTTNDKKEMGTDEYLYHISSNKIEEMKKFLETAIKTSVEKTLHKTTKLRGQSKQYQQSQVSSTLDMYPYLSLS